MKKFLLACVGLSCMMACVAGAATPTDCAYTPLQTLVRNARNADQIKKLMEQGVLFEDNQIRCGGSLLQLAVLRGNHEVLRALLEQDIKRATQRVSLLGYPIVGAPKELPILLFTAYYAPNENIMNLMVQAIEALGLTLNQTDDNGRNLLWYLDKNPVLRDTDLADSLTEKMLSGLSSQNATLGGATAPTQGAAGKTAPTARSAMTMNSQPVQREIQFQGLENGMASTQPIAQTLPPLAGEAKPSAGENIVEPVARSK